MGKRTIVHFTLTMWLLATHAQQGNGQADSLWQHLAGMTEREQVAFIDSNFAAISSRHYDIGIAMGEKALSMAQKNHWQAKEASLLRQMGIAYYLKGDYEACLPLYQQSLDLYEAIGDEAGQGLALKEMGNYFKRLRRYDKALEQLERSAALCASARDTNCLTAALDIKSVVLIEQGQLDEAKAVLLEEQALLLRNGNEQALSYTLCNLADVAIGQKRFEEAATLLAQSTAIRERLGDATGVAININNTGELYLRSGHPEKAKPYFEATIARTTAIGFTDLRRHAMQMLSETCSALGDHETAMQWLIQSYTLKDSLFSITHSQQIAEMAEKYEAEKKEKELVLQQQQLQSRNFQLAITAACLAILALFSIFMFRQQRQKQRQLQREAELKTELVKSDLSLRLQRERLRISRDLHDNLGAELTIIGSTLARTAARASNEQDKATLEGISNNARWAMAQLRETIWAIRHEQFTIGKLADKISDFANRAGAVPVHTELDVTEDAVLSPVQTLNLYRIAQEAIHNSLKHARASRIDVAFEQPDEGHIIMRITDNGCGFEEAKTATTGNGLINIQARAEEMGGTYSITSQPDKGTTVEVRTGLGE